MVWSEVVAPCSSEGLVAWHLVALKWWWSSEVELRSGGGGGGALLLLLFTTWSACINRVGVGSSSLLVISSSQHVSVTNWG